MSYYALYERYIELNRKCDAAEEEKRLSEKRENSLIRQRNSKNKQLSTKKTQKKNRENRLEGIKKIIKQLDGSAGIFSNDLPGKISKALNTLDKADNWYKASIKMYDGVPIASLKTALYTTSVSADKNSGAARAAYQTEKKRVETLISTLKKEIAKLEDEITALKRKINSENEKQGELKTKILRYQNEINDLKRRLL